MRSSPKLVIAVLALPALLLAVAFVPDAQAGPPADQAKKATYVGADACGVCHADKYKTYKETAHTKKTQPATRQTVVMPVDNKVITTTDGNSMFKLNWGGGALQLTLYNLDGTNPTTYAIERVMGGFGTKGGKQRLVLLVDENGNSVSAARAATTKVTRLISPVQYNHKEKNRTGDDKFNTYHGNHWYNADGTLIGSGASRFSMKVAASQFANSWERRCIGCHATGPSVKYDKRTGMFLNDGSEFNVWCEACHGPGSKHAASANAKDITNPEDLEAKKPQNALDICTRCHVRGGNVGSGAFTTGYPSMVKKRKIIFPKYGGLLADWYTPGEGTWDSSNADKWGKFATEREFSKKHHQQGYGYIQSKHWDNPYHQVFCWDCHDPHSTGVENPQMIMSSEDNTLCLSCHAPYGFGDEAAIMAHTLHTYDPTGLKTSRCTKCHNPKTAKSAQWWGDHSGDIHSHTFEPVDPNLTNRMAKANKGTVADGKAIPNGCNGCHTTDTDYGAARWKRWKKAGGGS